MSLTLAATATAAAAESLARKLARRSSVEPRQVNIDLLRAGFPARKVATVEQLEQMAEFLAEQLGQL